MSQFSEIDKQLGGNHIIQNVLMHLDKIKEHENNQKTPNDNEIKDPTAWINGAVQYLVSSPTVLEYVDPIALYHFHSNIGIKNNGLSNKPSEISNLLQQIEKILNEKTISAANYRLAKGKPIPVEASVSLLQSSLESNPEEAFWQAIVNRTQAIWFEKYDDFIKLLFAENFTGEFYNPASDKGKYLNMFPDVIDRRNYLLGQNIYGVDAYKLLKQATQAFLILEAGIVINIPRDEKTGAVRHHDSDAMLREYVGKDQPIPFIKKLPIIKGWLEQQGQGSPFAEGLLNYRYSAPSMMELIYSYWMEQGMLVQTMNAITLRYQNFSVGPNQVLKNFTLSPLRPLSNLLWGYIQDENNRLTLARRAAEYVSQYGLKLEGRAIPNFDNVDSRPRFLSALHNLLHSTLGFYKEDANTTIVADGFRLLNALREVHMILSDGAVNQFGDLTCASREEMLIMQWLLSRQEMREFLRGRPGTPYPEKWMEQVEAMKRLQDWPDISVLHFNHLAQYGEQLLLSIRYTDWTNTTDQNSAKRWARAWRPQVQSYVHAYQAVTGVNLAADNPDNRKDLQPSLLLKQRMPNAVREAEPEALSWEQAPQSEYGHVPYGYAQPRRTAPMRRS